MPDTESNEPNRGTVRNSYQRMHEVCGQIIVQSFTHDTTNAINKADSFLADVGLWIDVLSDRPEHDVLFAAVKEYQYSLLALLQGQYRHAFAALRYFLEKTLASIEFSAHEYHLRLWRMGQRDIAWKSIISADTGVLSNQFVGVFCDPLRLEASQYRIIAEKIYRECSEFVRGNAHTQEGLPEGLSFDATAFDTWVEKADSVRLVVSFALASRYVLGLNEQAVRKLEPAILETLGHVSAIREIFGAATEELNG